ncbi:hypothetical protein Vi05172_g2798 [Venturia inaequalis]|nr:hypothetical protein Vi05172_g2798 [Venturia inaequalis]
MAIFGCVRFCFSNLDLFCPAVRAEFQMLASIALFCLGQRRNTESPTNAGPESALAKVAESGTIFAPSS